MGKNDFLTPKAIANRIKAKGLQKLRWYCQMCEKQCRDENGFKCHCMSESHQRQMLIFGENPDRIVDGYSEEFEAEFLNHMKCSHRFSRIAATVVYNEYIANRNHIHMNSTKWLSLTEFVKYLGRTGKCKVEETPKGWFITYIDKDSEAVFKDKLKSKRLRAELVEEEKKEREIMRQIERAARDLGHGQEEAVAVEKGHGQGQFTEEDKADFVAGEVKFALRKDSGKNKVNERGKEGVKVVFEEEEEKPRKKVRTENGGGGGGGRTALEEMMKEEEKVKEKRNRKDYWLCEGIVVKVMSKEEKLREFYKMKGVVKKVIDKYVGEIHLIDIKVVVRIDQAELETVIPQIGGLVRIVNGAYRGSNARLMGVDTDKFCARVQIEKGVYDGRVLPAVDYEDICKILK